MGSIITIKLHFSENALRANVQFNSHYPYKILTVPP